MPEVASQPTVNGSEETRWYGLIRRGVHWRLTCRGWAALVLLILTGFAVFIRGVHPFLSVQAPVASDVLVVEGWVADYAMQAAAREFNRGEYRTIYVTGVPIERGAPLSEYDTYAALGAAVLNRFGVPTNRLQSVSAPDVRRDRTYASALALRDWMEMHDELPAGLNLVTVGPHARRSRLLYREAFKGACEIGVLAVEDEDYDPRRWWAYSQGVRIVLGETAAYVYARVFFRVSADRRVENETGEDPLESTP